MRPHRSLRSDRRMIGISGATRMQEGTSRRSSWYDDFAHEVFNNMVNVFSRTSSINHEALILLPIQCEDLGQQEWLTH
jgi:hypothetical protein